MFKKNEIMQKQDVRDTSNPQQKYRCKREERNIISI